MEGVRESARYRLEECKSGSHDRRCEKGEAGAALRKVAHFMHRHNGAKV